MVGGEHFKKTANKNFTKAPREDYKNVSTGAANQTVYSELAAQSNINESRPCSEISDG